MRERFGDVGERFAVVGFSATTKRGLADSDAILRGWLGS
jgi:hypothetical protein